MKSCRLSKERITRCSMTRLNQSISRKRVLGLCWCKDQASMWSQLTFLKLSTTLLFARECRSKLLFKKYKSIWVILWLTNKNTMKCKKKLING
jgi:hypothetical protein